MIVGVPKEVKNQEYRVGLTASGVRALKAAGHQVLVEKNAGAGSQITDEKYISSGAEIISSAEEVWSRSDMIVKVKEPLPQEFQFMREGLTLYTYLHLANELELTKALMEKGVTAVAYETIQLIDGSLPLLTPMSEVAGRMSTQIGAHFLQKEQGGMGVLLGGVPGVERSVVTILGGGVAGTNAAKIAVGMGAIVNIIDLNDRRLAYLDDIFGGRVNTLHSNIEHIEKCVRQSDLVIGSVLIPGAKAPKLVNKALVESMKPGSVVVDIAVDQGGCIETCRPTSHDEPTYKISDVIHYCVPNMPGAVARTSTFALTNVTTRYAVDIANYGLQDAVKRSPQLKKGINVSEGFVRYKQVADDLNLPYKALDL